MKILYLYSEVMGYTLATVKEIVKLGAEVHIVFSDKNKLTPFIAPKIKNVYFYRRSNQSEKTLIQLSKQIKPEIAVVSGWTDRVYLNVSKILKKLGVAVVCGLDNQWHNTSKQKLALILGKCNFFLNYFSHVWVAGSFQYEYARKIGFSKNKIIYDLYSADLSIFKKKFSNYQILKKKYPHRFLFVGRYEHVKGLDILIDAWKKIKNNRKDWELHLIGNGSLKNSLKKISGIKVKDFMQPKKLISEILKAGCFILPSRKEPWGVIVHEMAASGLPLIVSDVVGSRSTFLIHDHNGFLFKSEDSFSLSIFMKKIINMSDKNLKSMCLASLNMSNRITPTTSAKNLLSIK